MTKLFKVAAVSNSPNSFGLWGHVLIAKDGTAYEVARSHSISSWARGTDIEVPLSETGVPCWASVSCEIPRELPKAPAKVVKEVWRKVNALGIPVK